MADSVMVSSLPSPQELDRACLRLWAELKANVRGPYPSDRIPFWDAPITPTTRRRNPQVAVKCGRCDGKGAIASFSVRYSGVCFACSGSGLRYISRAAHEKKKALQKATQGV